MQVDVAKLIMSLSEDEVDILLEDLLVDVVRQLTFERRFEVSNHGAYPSCS